jgi:hypothetical protein
VTRVCYTNNHIHHHKTIETISWIVEHHDTSTFPGWYFPRRQQLGLVPRLVPKLHGMIIFVSPSCILYRSGGLRSRHTLRISMPSTARDDSDTSWQSAIVRMATQLVNISNRLDSMEKRMGKRIEGMDMTGASPASLSA